MRSHTVAERKQKGRRKAPKLYKQIWDEISWDGRGGGIRTRDPLHPMQVRYQAAPRPDLLEIISEAWPLDWYD